MGRTVQDNQKTNDDGQTEIFEGEHEAVQNFQILYHIGLETFVRREVAENGFITECVG